MSTSIVPTILFNDSFYFQTREKYRSFLVWNSLPSFFSLFSDLFSRSFSRFSPLPPSLSLSLCPARMFVSLGPSRVLVSGSWVSIFLPLPRLEGRRSGNKGWLRPFSSALEVFLLFSPFFLFARRSSGTVYQRSVRGIRGK